MSGRHPAPPRTIALFGAAGRTGRRVLDRLLARGTQVRALAGDPSRLPPHPSLVAIAGDARDRAAVERTIEGASAIVACLGMRDIGRPGTEFSDAVRTIVEAAQAARIRRIVAVASAAVLPDARGGLRGEHAGPGPYANVNAEHVRNYRTLAGSALDWTLLCPVDLAEDIPEGRARLADESLPAGSDETGYEDLAATIVALLDDPASWGRRVGIVSVR
jgi:putative NADH-flavin reductase